jgi:DNA repair protein RadC
MQYNLSIKNWSVEDRPREKLLNKGTSSLSDAELLAILIGSGTRNLSALELSKNILHSVGNNLHELGKLNMKDLTLIKGIGNAKAISLLAAIELGRRRTVSDPIAKIKINSSKDVCNIFQPVLGDLPNEQFWILLLNRSNLVIDRHLISSGGTSGTVIDTKIILKYAIDRLASGLILCHNHPSGNTTPSDADKSITRKIQNAVSMVDISLLDHIIIGDKGYFSFADNALI